MEEEKRPKLTSIEASHARHIIELWLYCQNTLLLLPPFSDIPTDIKEIP
jgi:hypothetical protein